MRVRSLVGVMTSSEGGAGLAGRGCNAVGAGGKKENDGWFESVVLAEGKDF